MNILKTIRPVETAEGAGVVVKRVMPTHLLTYHDPFLMLDHFAIQKPAGFPTHPHRGFEIITYMLEGAFEHKDSAGNEGIIHAGGLQRITAGRGIFHSEFPAGDGINEGLQLWINLPRAEKGIEPGYQECKADEIPQNVSDGIRVRILVGDGSPVRVRRPMFYHDVELSAGKTYTQTIPKGYQSLIYILEGSGSLGKKGDVLILRRAEQEDTIQVTSDGCLRFVILAGEPIGEQPYFRGSFVD